MRRKILNVAEKSSVAKEIVKHLKGNNHATDVRVHGQTVSSFQLATDTDCEMLITAVRGHLVEYDFKEDCRKWDSIPPYQLFDADIVDRINADNRPIAKCLAQMAQGCHQLNLWLDCDREGEAICFEVMSVCLKSNPRLLIKRAVFSALTHADLSNALRNLSAPNRHMANAVMARTHLDLRSGAAFTRFLTMRYHSRISNFYDSQTSLISYGPCQFPTLGLVFERWQSIQDFRTEPFWAIVLKVTNSHQSDETISCSWERRKIFDELIVNAIFENCARAILESDGLISIANCTQQPRRKWRPLPLNTVEMTKLASSKLHIPSHRCMKIAESLYTRGIISYPRTETEIFHQSMDTRSLAYLHLSHSLWGGYCNDLFIYGKWTEPRRGQKNDNAHPPIHPVKSVERSELEYDDWRLYELITRHFLAVCSPDATAVNSNVTFNIDEEKFTIDGLTIIEKNWLEVFHYEQWTSSAFTIPTSWRVGSLVPVSDFCISQSHTTAPLLLSESELIAKMDMHGIGTDATMHEHIRTVQERNYVRIAGAGHDRFEPTALGVALCRGFASYADLKSLIEPDLRSSMENGIAAIANGTLNPTEFITASIRKLRDLFHRLTDFPNLLDASFNAIHTANNSHESQTSVRRQVAGRSNRRFPRRGGGRGARRLVRNRRQR